MSQVHNKQLTVQEGQEGFQSTPWTL